VEGGAAGGPQPTTAGCTGSRGGDPTCVFSTQLRSLSLLPPLSLVATLFVRLLLCVLLAALPLPNALAPLLSSSGQAISPTPER